jgi:hypothetical protein
MIITLCNGSPSQQKDMKSPVEVKKAIQLNLLDMIKLNAASITQPIVVSMSHMDPLSALLFIQHSRCPSNLSICLCLVLFLLLQ